MLRLKRETSSKPVAARAASTNARVEAGFRSRTGRDIRPRPRKPPPTPPSPCPNSRRVPRLAFQAATSAASSRMTSSPSPSTRASKKGATGSGVEQGGAPPPAPRARGVGPLGPDMVPPVQNAVEQAQPQVGHAHFVQIGEQQGHPQGHGPGVFEDRVDLPAQVLAGPLDAMEKGMVVTKGHDKSVI